VDVSIFCSFFLTFPASNPVIKVKKLNASSEYVVDFASSTKLLVIINPTITNNPNIVIGSIADKKLMLKLKASSTRKPYNIMSPVGRKKILSPKVGLPSTERNRKAEMQKVIAPTANKIT
jgi:hypothetical protein